MKKGFTLIELLAVIIILAVIALITIPLVINTIDEARRGSFKDSAYGIISAAEQKQAKEAVKNGGILQVQTYDLTGTDLSYKGSKPKEGKAVVNTKGQVALEMNNGALCITKGYTDKDVTVTTVSDDNPCDGSNAGLTPEACFVTADNTDGGVTITDYICNQRFVSSYDINYENCMASFEGTDISESDQELYCTGKETSEGYSIDGDIALGETQWLIDDGIIENVAWIDPITDVIIPSKIGGKNVTRIASSSDTSASLMGRSSENSIKATKLLNSEDEVQPYPAVPFPETGIALPLEPAGPLTRLYGPFSSKNLTSVIIPNTVTTIGKAAFASNQLTSVEISDSVTTIESWVFAYNQLTSVTIPSSVTSLGCSAFIGNNNINIQNESAQEYKECTQSILPQDPGVHEAY